MPATNLESVKSGDLVTAYNVVGGNKLFKKPANRNNSFYFQVIWTGMNALDGKITAQGSNEDINYDDLSLPNSVNIDSANGSASMQCAECDAAHMGFNYEKGTATAGSLIVLVNEN